MDVFKALYEPRLVSLNAAYAFHHSIFEMNGANLELGHFNFLFRLTRGTNHCSLSSLKEEGYGGVGSRMNLPVAGIAFTKFFYFVSFFSWPLTIITKKITTDSSTGPLSSMPFD